jgi:hypothetical protein
MLISHLSAVSYNVLNSSIKVKGEVELLTSPVERFLSYQSL